MNRKLSAVFLVILGWIFVYQPSDGESLSATEILRKIVEKAKNNEKLANEIGYQQITTERKMKHGQISDEKIQMHRVIWVENEPYLELLKVNGKDLNEKEKKEEKKRKAKFIKTLREKKKEDPENVSWEDLYSKYDFQQLPADSIAVYVFSFRPKSVRLMERSKIEKVLNRILGRFWVDENFNIVQAEAKLLDDVRFGLGILGILEKLEMKYQQQNFEDVPVPSHLYIHYKARVALVKAEERKIEASFTDFYRRAGDSGPGAP